MGKLQAHDKETPHPYGVYGTPNWHVDRDRRTAGKAPGAKAMQPRRKDLAKEHVWRSYDLIRMSVMLYYHMYEIAKNYPPHVEVSRWPPVISKRAYQTAPRVFSPILMRFYSVGITKPTNGASINELIVPGSSADAPGSRGFSRPGRLASASEWGEKGEVPFVYDDALPVFVRSMPSTGTAFESSYAFAK